MVDEIWVVSKTSLERFFKRFSVADSRAVLVRIPYGNLAKTDTFVDVKFNNFVKLVFSLQNFAESRKKLKKTSFSFFLRVFFEKHQSF